MMKPISLLRGMFTVGIWTLLSRVLGLVREVLILGLIGPGPVMDAFVAAFRLPNMFRRFFAEGAFNAAFVPMYSKRLEAGDNPDGFANEAASGLAFVLMALTALALIFMPALVLGLAQGFEGTQSFDLTVGYGRIMFPYILFISLSALFSGVLNAAGHFAAAAAAPVLLNIMIIAAMTAAWALGGPAITWLIWTVPIAGIAQLALVWVAADRAGHRIRIKRPRWTPAMKALVLVAIPAILSNGVMQINLLVGTQVASHFDSAVSWLYGADRLYQLPLGVVGIAIGIVLLPDLSRRLKAGDTQGSQRALSRAAEMSLTLALPAAVALAVVPVPLVSALYERGATVASDVQAMALAVMVYAIGLPAFVLQKVLQPVFYAREDTRRPFHYAVIAMIINAVIAIGLAPRIGWIACAWATTIAGWAMVACLAWGARGYGASARLDTRFWQRAWRITLAAGLMGLALWGLMSWVGPTSGAARYGLALVLVITGMVTYGIAGLALGAFRPADLRASLRR